MAKQLSAKQRRFIEFYVGDAKQDCRLAAELAGYNNPKTNGYHLKRQLKVELDEALTSAELNRKMSPEEVVERLTTVGRDINHKDHLKALELMAKIHGLISEKIQVAPDRKTIALALQEELQRLSGSAVVIEDAQPLKALPS